MGEECSGVLDAWSWDSECHVHKRRLRVCWMAKEDELKALRERLGEALDLIRTALNDTSQPPAKMTPSEAYVWMTEAEARNKALRTRAEALLAGKGGKA